MTKPHWTDRVLSFHSPAPTETIEGCIRNALQISTAWGELGGQGSRTERAFDDITRLLRQALEGLGEPNEAAKDAMCDELRRMGNAVTEVVTRGAQNDAPEVLDNRWVRDSTALVLNAQIRGIP